jgi:hypothetical protein
MSLALKISSVDEFLTSNLAPGAVVPIPTLPDAVILPDGKEKPLESSNEPEKELDAVLVEYIGPER